MMERNELRETLTERGTKAEIIDVVIKALQDGRTEEQIEWMLGTGFDADQMEATRICWNDASTAVKLDWIASHAVAEQAPQCYVQQQTDCTSNAVQFVASFTNK